MTIKDTLKEDLKTAMKAGDTAARSTLGMLLASIKNRELEKRSRLAKSGTAEAELDAASHLTDEEIIEVLSTEAKKRKESITQFESGGRSDLAANEKAELALLANYLPEQLSDEQVAAQVEASIRELNPQGLKDMGKVIGHVMAKVKGRADGTVVSTKVKEALAKLS